MVSFKSLFVVAATALAAFASPLPSPAAGDALAVLPARELVVENSALTSRADAAILGGCQNGCGTLAEIIVAVQVDVSVHIKAIQNAVKANAGVDVYVALIAKIELVIKAAIGHVQTLPHGTQVDVNVFVSIFVQIIAILKVSVGACGQAHAVLVIIAQLQVTISIFLKACFSVVSGLDNHFCSLLNANVIVNIKALALVDIIAVIKVHLSVNLLGLLGINIGINL
jgi:hypothetical protein